MRFDQKYPDKAAIVLRSYKKGDSIYEIGKEVGISGQSVCNLLQRNGVERRRNEWSSEEIEALNKFCNLTPLDGPLPALEEIPGLKNRHNTNICRKMRELGLINPCHKYSWKKPKQNKYPNKEALSLAISERIKKHFSENGHPKGMKGKHHSDDVKALIGVKSKQTWDDPDFRSKYLTDERRQQMSDNSMNYNLKRSRNGFRNYSRAKSGKREDLDGLYVRSRWEANYARYLNWMQFRGEIKTWEYEPRTFIFEQIKRGTRSYTPDFKVYKNDGTYEWHEVKGWMDQKSRTNHDRMARYFPEEKIVLIKESFFSSAIKNGLTSIIPNWETDGSKNH